MARPYWELRVPLSEHISEGLTNLVWELGALGVVEDEGLRAFFPPDVVPGTLDARVREYLEDLRALGFSVVDSPPVVTPLADEAWAEAWKAYFRPIEVGTRLLVAPPWDVPSTSRLTIVIEPGRAFGTGHHGTTAGCLVLLERLCGAVGQALDLGTGSGILAIAAAKLGVEQVHAVDSDPDAIAAAVANAARNGVADRVRCAMADAAEITSAGAPLVVANLLASTHLGFGALYARLVAPGGRLLLGGMLDHEAAGVTEALGTRGFTASDREVADGWASLTFRRW